jgi:hypothetical protein
MKKKKSKRVGAHGRRGRSERPRAQLTLRPTDHGVCPAYLGLAYFGLSPLT